MFTNPHLAERDAWSDQIRENSARHAFAWGDATTSGWGEARIGDPIMFDCTFVEQPLITYGCSVDDEELIEEGWYPRATGGVYRWLQDANDHYIGAHVYVTVDVGPEAMTKFIADYVAATNDGTGGTYSPVTDAPIYELTHSFLFAGMARKDSND